jgi:hypothetical protein
MNLPFIEDLIQSINNLLEVIEGNNQETYKKEARGFWLL